MNICYVYKPQILGLDEIFSSKKNPSKHFEEESSMCSDLPDISKLIKKTMKMMNLPPNPYISVSCKQKFSQ